MITHIDITGVNYEVDEVTRKYIRKKIGALDRLAPRHARKSMRAEVKISEVNRDNGNKYEAEAIIFVPNKRLTAKDTTANALAAVDIIAAKLSTQLHKYKDAALPHTGKRKLFARFRR